MGCGSYSYSDAVLTIYFMNKNADYKKSIEKLFND